MAAIVLLNVVWIPTLLGLDRAVTWLVAAALLSGQLFLVSLAFRFPLRRALGAPGWLIVAALASYLVIGAIMAIGVTPYPFEDLLKYGYAIVTVMAAAVGGSLALRQAGIENLARGSLALLGATCILTVASPALDAVFTYTHRADYRFRGVFTDPNDAGYVGCLAVALALLSARRHRKLAGAVLGLGVGAIILSGSRTAILTLVPVLLFFLLLTRRSFSAWLVVAGVGSIITFVVIAPDRLPRVSEDYILQMQSVSKPFEPGGGAENNRLYLWRLSLSQIAESPVLGSGLGESFGLGGNDCGGTIPVPCGPHNTYLLLLQEAGIVPLALFLLFLASLLWQRLRSGPSLAGNIAAGWGVIFTVYATAFHHLLYSPWYGFSIGLSCALMAYAAETAGRGSRGPARQA